MPSPMVEILTLEISPKLIENLGVLSRYAKCGQIDPNQNNFETLILYPKYDGMFKNHLTLLSL
jgi:hypothetical protein